MDDPSFGLNGMVDDHRSATIGDLQSALFEAWEPLIREDLRMQHKILEALRVPEPLLTGKRLVVRNPS